LAIEHEVKLPFGSIEAARHAVEAAGGRLVHARRLIDDRLFDDDAAGLRAKHCALRIRRDGTRAFITWKGRPEAGPIKSREEIETLVGDADVTMALLSALGYRQVFRSQKYRAEYRVQGALVTIDETPFGVFVEIEAEPAAIDVVASALDRRPGDYVLDSYPALWRQWCDRHGRAFGDMLFD
jgi:adenylate cyclase class 2